MILNKLTTEVFKETSSLLRRGAPAWYPKENSNNRNIASRAGDDGKRKNAEKRLASSLSPSHRPHSVKLRINRSTLKDKVSLHRTAPNWINYVLHRKENYNKSNILRLATQYSLNLFVKRYDVIVNKHCWIIKHPCRLRINLCRSRKVLPCQTSKNKIWA